ncbi:MAG: hypothetical protein ACI87W_001892 [Halieaceae bacterium]|jgi:hypothetical protein
MLTMLLSPILLFTMAQLIFPKETEHENLEEFYFANPRLL